MARARQPRDFVDPADAAGFGKARELTWTDPGPGATAELSAAYRQHHFVAAVTATLRAEGLTREQFAERAGMGTETLRRKLRGEQWLAYKDISLIALALPPGSVPLETPGPLPDLPTP